MFQLWIKLLLFLLLLFFCPSSPCWLELLMWLLSLLLLISLLLLVFPMSFVAVADIPTHSLVIL
jgi:hypothetical protein